MRNWMKQLNRVIVLALMLVCLFGCLPMKAEAAYSVGWQGSDSAGWWYIYETDGTNYKCYKSQWAKIDGAYYYFDSDGWMVTNDFVPVDNNPNSNKDCYVGANGKRVSGDWVYWKNNYYYILGVGERNTQGGGADHVFATNWLLKNGKYYYLGDNGAMRTGLTSVPGDATYYFGASNDGAMKTKLWYKHSDGTWYYFGDDGRSKTSKITVTNKVNGVNATCGYTLTVWTGDGNKTQIRKDTFSLSNGQSWTSPSVPTNAIYTVTQTTTPTGYTKTSGGTSDNSLTGNETAAFVNTQNTYKLTITNKVEGADKAFTFSLTVNGASKGTFTLKNGEKKEFDGIAHGSTYEVKLTQDAGYTASRSSASGTMTGAKTEAFTNTQKTYKLTITNKVEGADKAFTFSLTVNGASKGTFTLKNGEKKEFDGIAHGSTYTVTQTEDAGYTMAKSNASGTMDGAKTASFTNTQKKYNLTVSNTVVGVDKEFTYSVTIGGADKGTFTLKNGQTKVFESIAHGTQYTVTQTTDTGYALTKSNDSGSMTSAKTASFTNTQQVTLSVTNTVVGADKKFEYSVVINGQTQPGFTLANGETWTSEPFSHGTGYSVTQVADPGYITTSAGATGTMAAGATAAFTNTQRMLDLTVTKQVAGRFAQADRKFDITITVDGEEPVAVSLGHDESTTISQIPYGTTYTVTEADYTHLGYSVSGIVTSPTALTDDTAAVTVTNTQEEAVLTVAKQVNGTEEAKETEFTFTLNAWYADGTVFVEDQTFTLTDGATNPIALPKNATYTIVQTEDEDFAAAVTGNTEGTMADNATVTFIDSQLLNLKIQKTVAGNMAQTDKKFTITLTYLKPGDTETTAEVAQLAHGEEANYILPHGTVYSVTEATYPGYTTAGTVAEVTLEEDAVITVVNTQEEATLTVDTVVVGSDEAKTQEFDFTLNVWYADGTSYLTNQTFKLSDGSDPWSILLPQSAKYTITETENDDFVTYVTDNGNGEQTLAEDTTVTFTNMQMMYLTVKKTVVGATAKEGKTFDFTVELDNQETVTFSLADGQSRIIENIPYGTGYTVTEADYSGQGYSTKNRIATGTMTSNAVVTVTNTQEEASLTVSKEVIGTDAAKETEFAFTLTAKYADGTDYITETFTLKHGESKEVVLPKNAAYTITEERINGFESNVTGDSTGTLAEDEAVTFTSTQLLNLAVTKQVVGETGETDKTFNILVSYREPGSSLVESSFPLKHGETMTYVNLPYGTTYEVTEQAVTGYAATYSENAVGTLTDNVTVVVTNTAEEHSLTVTKQVIGTDAAKENDEFTFTISATRANGTAYLTNRVFTLKHGGSETIVLPAGCSYTVTENDAAGYLDPEISGNYEITGMTQDEAVTFTNTQLTTLTLTNKVGGNMGSKEQPFAYTVKLGDGIQAKAVNGTVAWNEESGVYTLELIHDQSVTFTVPYGMAYVITEEDYSEDGYETEINGADSAEDYTATGTAEAETVVYKNSKSFTIPTGVKIAVLPFLGMMACGTALGIVLLTGGSGRSRRGRYLDR